MAGSPTVKIISPMTDQPACPCGSGQLFANCCRQFIDGDALPGTAELLMRSRYTAYVLNREDYLLRTWDIHTRPAHLGLLDAQPVKWLGLKILAADTASEGDRAATVEFVARYQINGRAHRLHEISRFVCTAGQWFYLDGTLQE